MRQMHACAHELRELRVLRLEERPSEPALLGVEHLGGHLRGAQHQAAEVGQARAADDPRKLKGELAVV